MTWYPVAYLPSQYVDVSGKPYSGAVMKTYRAGTSTPILMATTYLGTTVANTFELNALGIPVSGGMPIIPHIQEDYKIVLYPTQAAADANSGGIFTIDNVKISDEAGDAFVQSFSGDGTTTAFILSEDLGTVEESLMIFADKKFGEYVTNGPFASDTGWTKGTGWTISAGTASATTASSDLSQTSALPIINEESYTITYTVTRSAGDITPKIGGRPGATRNASGTYTETIIASNTQAIAFTGASFTGTVDNVSIHRTNAARREILRPDEFTLNAVNLVFDEAPASGTNNIIVFAPSKLPGFVSSLADEAAQSETNAALYAANALAAQTAAENARDATLAAYDSFDDRYLGVKASDPTVDNDGNPLVSGALYFSSTDNFMKLYTGTAWVAAYVSGGGALQVVNNLADLSNPATARTNLGLGALAIKSIVDATALVADNILTYAKLAASAIATTVAELNAGTVGKLVDAATLKAWFDTILPIGWGQTWQSVTRVSGTTYTNSTGRPIMVACQFGSGGSPASLTVTINGFSLVSPATPTSVTNVYTFIVPNGQTYVMTASVGSITVSELR